MSLQRNVNGHTRGELLRGTVQWFNAQKGFGFIGCDGRNDLFVHHTNINQKGYRSLVPGQIVEFEVSDSVNGKPQAVNVTVVTAAE